PSGDSPMRRRHCSGSSLRRGPPPAVCNPLREEFGLMSEQQQTYPLATRELAEQRKRLAPKPAEAFKAFSRSVFAEGALPAKTKQLIAVAVGHVPQCPYCIRGHTTAALRQGATAEEIMEAIWVAAEMRAG